mgnify:CR=1 FL=1
MVSMMAAHVVVRAVVRAVAVDRAGAGGDPPRGRESAGAVVVVVVVVVVVGLRSSPLVVVPAEVIMAVAVVSGPIPGLRFVGVDGRARNISMCKGFSISMSNAGSQSRSGAPEIEIRLRFMPSINRPHAEPSDDNICQLSVRKRVA